MTNPGQVDKIVDISQSDSSSESETADIQTATVPGVRQGIKYETERASTLENMPEGRGSSIPQRARLFSRPPPLLTDQLMEEELLFCLRQFQCYEDEVGIALRDEVIKELDCLVKQWSGAEASRRKKLEIGSEVVGRVLPYGSYKLSVIDKHSDLDLLCVFPKHVSRARFFRKFYTILQEKVRCSLYHMPTVTYNPTSRER